jgi:hypothetical protein
MVAAAMQAVYSLVVVLYLVGNVMLQKRMLATGGAPPSGNQDLPALLIGGTFMIVMVLLGLAFSGMMAFGGWKMMRLQGYAFALTGAILAMVAGIPCSCCPVNTIIDWPIGIWALVTLADSSVKAAFDQESSVPDVFT